MSALADALAARTARQASEPMTEAQAEARGRLAVSQGRGNFPLADEALAAELADAQVGEKTHLMAAFNRGWHAAFARQQAILFGDDA